MSSLVICSVAPEGAARRFVHVIGGRVWIDDQPADAMWSTYVVGLIDGACWVGVLWGGCAGGTCCTRSSHMTSQTSSATRR